MVGDGFVNQPIIPDNPGMSDLGPFSCRCGLNYQISAAVRSFLQTAAAPQAGGAAPGRKHRGCACGE